MQPPALPPLHTSTSSAQPVQASCARLLKPSLLPLRIMGKVRHLWGIGVARLEAAASRRETRLGNKREERLGNRQGKRVARSLKERLEWRVHLPTPPTSTRLAFVCFRLQSGTRCCRNRSTGGTRRRRLWLRSKHRMCTPGPALRPSPSRPHYIRPAPILSPATAHRIVAPSAVFLRLQLTPLSPSHHSRLTPALPPQLLRPSLRLLLGGPRQVPAFLHRLRQARSRHRGRWLGSRRPATAAPCRHGAGWPGAASVKHVEIVQARRERYRGVRGGGRAGARDRRGSRCGGCGPRHGEGEGKRWHPRRRQITQAKGSSWRGCYRTARACGPAPSRSD
jgi:hypothetical protein